MGNTELDNVRGYGKKMLYIAILAGLINFIPGVLISSTRTPYFNWMLLGFFAILVSLLAYRGITTGKELKDLGGLLINAGWLFVAIGIAIFCSAFSEFYFVSWTTGIFNAIAAIMLIFPSMYFMSAAIKEAKVSIVP